MLFAALTRTNFGVCRVTQVDALIYGFEIISAVMREWRCRLWERVEEEEEEEEEVEESSVTHHYPAAAAAGYSGCCGTGAGEVVSPHSISLIHA